MQPEENKEEESTFDFSLLDRIGLGVAQRLTPNEKLYDFLCGSKAPVIKNILSYYVKTRLLEAWYYEKNQKYIIRDKENKKVSLEDKTKACIEYYLMCNHYHRFQTEAENKVNGGCVLETLVPRLYDHEAIQEMLAEVRDEIAGKRKKSKIVF